MADDSLQGMPEFDRPENIPVVIVPDQKPNKKICKATTKAGKPCPMHTVKGSEDYCLGHAKSLDPALRQQWRTKQRVLLGPVGVAKLKYYSREEVLAILTKRIALWMDRFGDVLTEGVDEAICDLARTYAVVAKVEVAENAEIRGWRMKGTG